jgi:hypothetical protein
VRWRSASALLGLYLLSPGSVGADEPGIQDNSFLLEESYNQERPVVQHITSYARSFDTHAWGYTFTR